MAKAKKAAPPTAVAAQDTTAILKELEMIRRLLMLLAVKIGASTGELGVALGVTQQRASQLIAAGKIKKLKLSSATDGDD
jgi:hypothetical protein